jgi:hypothetical protein
MAMKQLLTLWIGLVALTVGLLGCQGFMGLGPSSQIPPSSVGVEMDIDQLKTSSQSYEIFYAAKRYNPSAVLFLYPEKRSLLELAPDWKPVDSKGALHDLIKHMKETKPHLSALVLPKDGPQGSEDVLGFIYTPAYASMRPVKDKTGTYYLRSVSEQFNPVYFGGDGEGADSPM